MANATHVVNYKVVTTFAPVEGEQEFINSMQTVSKTMSQVQDNARAMSAVLKSDIDAGAGYMQTLATQTKNFSSEITALQYELASTADEYEKRKDEIGKLKTKADETKDAKDEAALKEKQTETENWMRQQQRLIMSRGASVMTQAEMYGFDKGTAGRGVIKDIDLGTTIFGKNTKKSDNGTSPLGVAGMFDIEAERARLKGMGDNYTKMITRWYGDLSAKVSAAIAGGKRSGAMSDLFKDFMAPTTGEANQSVFGMDRALNQMVDRLVGKGAKNEGAILPQMMLRDLAIRDQQGELTDASRENLKEVVRNIILAQRGVKSTSAFSVARFGKGVKAADSYTTVADYVKTYAPALSGLFDKEKQTVTDENGNVSERRSAAILDLIGENEYGLNAKGLTQLFKAASKNSSLMQAMTRAGMVKRTAAGDFTLTKARGHQTMTNLARELLQDLLVKINGAEQGAKIVGGGSVYRPGYGLDIAEAETDAVGQNLLLTDKQKRQFALRGRTGELVDLIANASDDSRSDPRARIVARRALSRMQAGGAATEDLRALDIVYRIMQDKDSLAKSEKESAKTDIGRISYAPGVRDRQEGYYIKQIFPFEEGVAEKDVDVSRANRERFLEQWQSDEKGAHIAETVSYTNPVTGHKEILTREEYLRRREKDEASAAAYIKPYFDNTRRYQTDGAARGLVYRMTDPRKIARTGMVVMNESPITRALGLGHAENGEFTDKIAEVNFGDLTKLSKEQEGQYIQILKSFGVIDEDENTGEIAFNPNPTADNGYIFHVNHGQSGVTSRLIKAEDYHKVSENFKKFTDYASGMLGVDSSVFGDFWHNALTEKTKFKDFSAFAKFMDNLNKSHTPGVDITGGAIDWVNMLDVEGNDITPERIFARMFGGLGREINDPNKSVQGRQNTISYNNGTPGGDDTSVVEELGTKVFKPFTPVELSKMFGTTIGITGHQAAPIGGGGTTPRTAFVDFEALWAQTGARGKKWGFDDTAEGSSFIDSAFMRTGTSQIRGGLAFKGNMTAQKDMIKMFAENFGTVEEDANGGKKYTVEMPTPYGEKVTLEAVYDKDGKMIGSNYDAMIGKSMVKNKELYVGGASLKNISKSIAEGTYDPTTAGIYYDYMKQQYDRRTDPHLNGLFGTSSGAENITFEEFVNGNEELRQEAMRRANLGMTAVLAASGGISMTNRFKDDGSARNIGIQAAQWIPMSPAFMEAQAEAYEQMRARTYTLEGIRALYGATANEENNDIVLALMGKKQKGDTGEYFTPEEWIASHASDIESKRQDYLRARQQDMASGMIVDFNDGDISVKGAPEGSHRFNLIESEIKNDDPNKKYMATDFKNERVVTNAYMARLQQLGITEDKEDMANWVQTLNELDYAMEGVSKDDKDNYDKEYQAQAMKVYRNLMERAGKSHSDVLRYDYDENKGKHVGFGFESFLTALKALQTAKGTLQGELQKQTDGKFGTLTNEQLMGIMTLQGFGKKGDKYSLGKGLIDFENMDSLKEAIIRSPTGFNQIIARTNYASFMKPVLEKMGVSTSGLFLNLGDMQKLAGADWDGDMIKTVLSRRYSMDKGEKAASGFVQLADRTGKLRKTEKAQQGRKSTFDLVESIEAQEAAIDALKLFDDYDQFEDELEKKLDVKSLSNVDKGRKASEKGQILNRAALIREIQGRLGARMGMGLTSAVGSRLSSFDLVDPRYSQLARIAEEANYIYDIETTNAKRPTTYKMTSEQYQALGLGPEWGKMFGLLEGAEDVVMSKKGEYVDSTGAKLDPRMVHRVGGRADSNGAESDVFVKYSPAGLGRKLQNGGFAIDEMQFMSKYNNQHLLATTQAEIAKYRGVGDEMISQELVHAFTDEAEYETDENGRIKTTNGGEDIYGATRTGGGLGYGLFDYAEWSNGIQGLDKVKRLMKNARYIKAQQAGANHMVISDVERDILALQMAEANAQIEKYVDDYFVKNKIEGDYIHLKNPYYEEGSEDPDKSNEYMDVSRKGLIARLKKEAGVGSISMMLGGRKFLNGGEWDTISNGITEDSLNMMLLSEDENKRRIAATILKYHNPGDEADLADTSYDSSFAGRYGYVDRMFGRAGSGYTVKRLKMAYEKNGLKFDEQAYIQRQNRGMRDAIDKARNEAAANGETISAQEAYKRASRAARSLGDSRFDPTRLPEQMQEINYYREMADRIREGAGAFVYDTETTGTDVHGSSIIQLSAAQLKKPGEIFDTFVNPGKNQEGVDIVTTDDVQPALAINHIDAKDILDKDTPTTKEALEKFIGWRDGMEYSIGYNSEGFDDRIIKNQAAKAGITGKQVIPTKNIDALMMLRTLIANGGVVDGHNLDEYLSGRIGDAYAREVYYENFGEGSEAEAANAARAAESAANQIEAALKPNGQSRRSLMTPLGDFKHGIKGATKLTTMASALLGLPIESLVGGNGAHDSSFDVNMTGAVGAKLMQSTYETLAKQAKEMFETRGMEAPAGYFDSLKAGAVYYSQIANAYKSKITGEEFYTTNNAAIDENVVNEALGLRVKNGSGSATDVSRIKTYFANTWTDDAKVSLIQSLVGDVTKDVETAVKSMEGSAFGQNTPMAGKSQEFKKEFDKAIAEGDYVAITRIARDIQQLTESSSAGRKYFNNDKLNQLKSILVAEQQATGTQLDQNGGYGYIDPEFSWDKMMKERAAARAKLAEMATRQEAQVEAGEAIAQANLKSTTVGFQTQDANGNEQYVVLDENGQARAIAKGQAVYEKFASMKEKSDKLNMGFAARRKDYTVDETTAAMNKNKARMGYEFGNIIADYEYAQSMQRALKASETDADYDANLKAIAGTMEGQEFIKRILGSDTHSTNEFMDYITSLNNVALHASSAVGAQALGKVKGRGQVATAYDTFKDITGVKTTKLDELKQVEAMVDLIETESTKDMTGLDENQRRDAQNAIREAKAYLTTAGFKVDDATKEKSTNWAETIKKNVAQARKSIAGNTDYKFAEDMAMFQLQSAMDASMLSFQNLTGTMYNPLEGETAQDVHNRIMNTQRDIRVDQRAIEIMKSQADNAQAISAMKADSRYGKTDKNGDINEEYNKEYTESVDKMEKRFNASKLKNDQIASIAQQQVDKEIEKENFMQDKQVEQRNIQLSRLNLRTDRSIGQHYLGFLGNNMFTRAASGQLNYTNQLQMMQEQYDQRILGLEEAKLKTQDPLQQQKLQAEIDKANEGKNKLQGEIDANSGFGGFMKNLGGNVLSQVITKVTQAFKKLINAAIQFNTQWNTAMAGVSAKSGLTGTALQELGDKIEAQATKLKVSSVTLANTYKALFAAGYDTSNIEHAAEVMTKFSAVTGQDVTKSMRQLTQVVKSGLVSSLDEAMDMLTAISDQSVATVADISKVLSKMSSISLSSGMTSSETTGLATYAAEIMGGSASVGNDLGLIVSRLSQLSTSSDISDSAVYKDSEGREYSLSNLSELQSVTGVQFMSGENGETLTPIEIMKNIATQWNDMSDAYRNTFTSLFGGTSGRQANSFTSLMNALALDPDLLDQYIETAENSSGTVDAQYATLTSTITAAKQKAISSITDSVTDFFGGSNGWLSQVQVTFWNSVSAMFSNTSTQKVNLDLDDMFEISSDKLNNAIEELQTVRKKYDEVTETISDTDQETITNAINGIADAFPAITSTASKAAESVAALDEYLKQLIEYRDELGGEHLTQDIETYDYSTIQDTYDESILASKYPIASNVSENYSKSGYKFWKYFAEDYVNNENSLHYSMPVASLVSEAFDAVFGTNTSDNSTFNTEDTSINWVSYFADKYFTQNGGRGDFTKVLTKLGSGGTYDTLSEEELNILNTAFTGIDQLMEEALTSTDFSAVQRSEIKLQKTNAFAYGQYDSLVNEEVNKASEELIESVFSFVTSTLVNDEGEALSSDVTDIMLPLIKAHYQDENGNYKSLTASSDMAKEMLTFFNAFISGNTFDEDTFLASGIGTGKVGYMYKDQFVPGTTTSEAYQYMMEHWDTYAPRFAQYDYETSQGVDPSAIVYGTQLSEIPEDVKSEYMATYSLDKNSIAKWNAFEAYLENTGNELLTKNYTMEQVISGFEAAWGRGEYADYLNGNVDLNTAWDIYKNLIDNYSSSASSSDAEYAKNLSEEEFKKLYSSGNIYSRTSSMSDEDSELTISDYEDIYQQYLELVKDNEVLYNQALDAGSYDELIKLTYDSYGTETPITKSSEFISATGQVKRNKAQQKGYVSGGVTIDDGEERYIYQTEAKKMAKKTTTDGFITLADGTMLELPSKDSLTESYWTTQLTNAATGEKAILPLYSYVEAANASAEDYTDVYKLLLRQMSNNGTRSLNYSYYGTSGTPWGDTQLEKMLASDTTLAKLWQDTYDENIEYSSLYPIIMKGYLGSDVDSVISGIQSNLEQFKSSSLIAQRLINGDAGTEDIDVLETWYRSIHPNQEYSSLDELAQMEARYDYYNSVSTDAISWANEAASNIQKIFDSVGYLYVSGDNGIGGAYNDIDDLDELIAAAERVLNVSGFDDNMIQQAQDVLNAAYMVRDSGMFSAEKDEYGWNVTANPSAAIHGYSTDATMSTGADVFYDNKFAMAPYLQQLLDAGLNYSNAGLTQQQYDALNSLFGVQEYIDSIDILKDLEAQGFDTTQAQNNVIEYQVKLQFEVDNLEGVQHYFSNITDMVMSVREHNDDMISSIATMETTAEELSQDNALAKRLEEVNYDITQLSPNERNYALEKIYGTTDLAWTTITSDKTKELLQTTFGPDLERRTENFARDARLMAIAEGKDLVDPTKWLEPEYVYNWEDYYKNLARLDWISDPSHITRNDMGTRTDLVLQSAAEGSILTSPAFEEAWANGQIDVNKYTNTNGEDAKEYYWEKWKTQYGSYSKEMSELYPELGLTTFEESSQYQDYLNSDLYKEYGWRTTFMPDSLLKEYDKHYEEWLREEFEKQWAAYQSGEDYNLFTMPTTDYMEAMSEPFEYDDMHWAQYYGYNPNATYTVYNGGQFSGSVMQTISDVIDQANGSSHIEGSLEAKNTVFSTLNDFKKQVQQYNELRGYMSRPDDVTSILETRKEVQDYFTQLTGIEMSDIRADAASAQEAYEWYQEKMEKNKEELTEASGQSTYSSFITEDWLAGLNNSTHTLDLTEHYLTNIEELCEDIAAGGTAAADAIKEIGNSAYELSQSKAFTNEIKAIIEGGGSARDLTGDQITTIMNTTGYTYEQLMGAGGNAKLQAYIDYVDDEITNLEHDIIAAKAYAINEEVEGIKSKTARSMKLAEYANKYGYTLITEQDENDGHEYNTAINTDDYSGVNISQEEMEKLMAEYGFDYYADWVNPNNQYGYSYNTMQTYAGATGATYRETQLGALNNLIQTSMALNEGNNILGNHSLESVWSTLGTYQRDILANILGVSASDIDKNVSGYSQLYAMKNANNQAERKEMLGSSIAQYDTKLKYATVSQDENGELVYDYSNLTDEQYMQFAQEVVDGTIVASDSVKELAAAYVACGEAADSAAVSMMQAKLAAAQTAAETQKMADVKTQILDLQNLGLAGEEAAEKVEAIIDAANFETQPEGLTNILTVIEQIKTGAIEAGQAMENILYSAGYSANISNDRVDNLAESAKAFFNIDESGRITGFKGETPEDQEEMYYSFANWWKQLQEESPAMAAAISNRYSWFDILARQDYSSDWFDSYNDGAGIGFTIAQNYTDIQNQKDLTDWANFVAEHNVGNNNWYEGIDSDIQTLITSENEVDKTAKATSIAQSIFDLSEKIRYAQMGYQAGNTRQQDVLRWSAADWADTKSVNTQIEDWIAEYGNYNEMLDFIKEEYPDVYEMITSAKSTIHDQTYDTSTNAMYSAKSAAQTEYVLDNMMSEITKNFTTNGQLNEGVTAEQIAASAQNYLLTHGASDILYYNEDFLSWYNGLLYNNDSVATNYEAGMSQFDLGRKNGYTSKQSKYFTPALLAEGFAAMQSGEWSDWFEENIDQNDVEDFKTAIEDRYGTYATNVINGTAMTDEDRADLIRKANQQAKAADWTQMVEAGTMSQEAYDTATAIEEIRAGYSNYTDSEYLEKIAEQRKSITEQQDQYNMYTAALDEYNASDKTQQDVETFLTAIGGDLSQSGNADYVAQQIKDAKTAKQSSYDYIEDLKTAFADNPELLALLGLDTGYSEYQSSWEAGTYTSAFNDDAMSQKFGEMLSSATSEEDFVSAVDSDANMQTWLLQHEDMLQLYKDLRDQQTSLTKAQKDYAKQTGKDSKSISEYSKNMLKLRESIQNVKYYVDKGTYNHSEGSDDMKDIASILGLSEQTVMAMTDGEIKQKLTTELEGLGEDYSDELQKVYDTVKGMNMSEYASGLNGEGKMTYQLGDIELVAGEIKEVGLEEAMAIAQSLGQEAIYNELASVEGMGGTVAMQQWIDDAGYYHVIMNGVELTNATGRRSSSSSGGGKSAAEKKVEKWKHKIEDRKHQINIAKGYEEYYQETGNLAQYGKELTVENQAQQNYIDTQEAAIADYKKSLSTVSKGSDDWYTLTDAIQEAEEEILSAKTAIEKNTKALEENRKAMRKTRTDLEDYYEQLIESEEKYEDDTLAGTVEMEDLILDAIKDRYQKEWDLQKEDLEKKKEALQEEKDMIDERLQARKDAEDAADEYEEIAELEKQLALISMDSTRASEAAEIREQLAEKKNALAWEEAETEAEAQSSILDDQINGIDDYIEAEDERVSNYLEDANNFADQVAEILGGTDEEIMQWLKDNVDEYSDYLDAAQEQQVEKWLDTYKQMMGITDTYWEKINSLISGGYETGAAYLMTTQEYINASDTEKYDMLMELKDMVDDYDSAYNTTKISTEYDALMAAALTRVENAINSGDEQKINSALSYYENLVTGTAEGLHTDSFTSGSSSSSTDNNTKAVTDNTVAAKDVSTKAQEVAEKISDQIQAIKDSGTNMSTVVTDVKNAVTSTVSTISSGISNAVSGISSWFNKLKIGGGTVESAADGGVFNYTGQVLVHGTNEHPEYIFNEDQLKALSKIGYTPYNVSIGSDAYGSSNTIGDVSITINQAEIASDVDVDRLAAQVGEKFVQQISTQGYRTGRF